MAVALLVAFVIAVVIAALPAAVARVPVGAPAHGPAVVGAHAVGSVIVVVGALAIAVLCTPVPPGLLAYVGLVPLIRGGRRLLSGSIRPDAGSPAESTASTPAHWFSVTRAWLDGGSDGFVVLAPLFATHAESEIAGLAVALVLATIASSAARAAFVARPALAAQVTAGLVRFSPWGLVAVGGYVMVAGGLFNWLRF